MIALFLCSRARCIWRGWLCAARPDGESARIAVEVEDHRFCRLVTGCTKCDRSRGMLALGLAEGERLPRSAPGILRVGSSR